MNLLLETSKSLTDEGNHGRDCWRIKSLVSALMLTPASSLPAPPHVDFAKGVYEQARLPYWEIRDGAVVNAQPVMGLPTTYVISPAGVVTHRAVSSREWDDPRLLELLRRMQKQN